MDSPATNSDPPLEGRLALLPAPRSDLLEVVADEYAALAAAYGPRNVLVLKRLPAGLEAVRERLAAIDAADGSPATPRVESIPSHAAHVLEEYDPTLDRLEYEERIELLALVIEGAGREVPPYLERASGRETFPRDVGRLLLEATRQNRRREDLPEDAHDCLAFLYAMNDRFHDELDARGLIERADVIPRAVEALEADADGIRRRVTDSFDAVLALEVEECRRLDRRYLAAVTGSAAAADGRDPGVELVCLGERHAAIDRTRVEPGRIDDLAGGGQDGASEGPHAAGSAGIDLDVVDERGRGAPDPPPHRAIARYLATGERTGEAATAYRIRTDTGREQIRGVAAEIEALCDRHGWRYDDVAVAVPTEDRVPAARDRLREAGVPTATIGTDALAEDPAVNELYAFVAYNCDREADVARDRLAARVPDFSSGLVDACVGSSVRRSLARWIVRTDLKGRIARDESWVDAREQYGSVRRVLEVARFVEGTDLVAPDWDGLRRMLRDTIRYDAPYVHAVDARPPAGGVVVCPIEGLKYDVREAVFLVDLVDGHYPGEGHLTRLFPTAWLPSMPSYPAVTDPSESTVEGTFGPAAGPFGDPFDAYHAGRQRRRLAIGARAARSRLYCCSYRREGDGLGRTRDESRYCRLLEAVPEFDLVDVDALDREAAIRGEANALEAVLDEPRDELERVVREANTGGAADLEETEALFEEIAVVLEAAVDPELHQAVRSGFEFAAGEVLRDG